MGANAESSARSSADVEAGNLATDNPTQEKPAPIITAALPVTDLQNGIIGWEGQNDPEMPLNWSAAKKWTGAILLAVMTFLTPLSSSILAPAIASVNKDFNNTNPILGALPVSIFLLGYAVGPLALAGLSEIYGRYYVLTASNTFFCAWHIGCALAPSLNSLITFRFLAGVGGSAVLTLGGGSISDCFRVEERGRGLAIWSVGFVVGPSLGPLLGAFVTETIGWRWDGWIVLIPGILVTVSLLFCPETNHKVLMRRKVARMKQLLGRDDLRSCYDTAEVLPTRSQILINGMMRPAKMMILSPIVVALSIHISFLYGTLYLLFNTISTVFHGSYGWNLGVSGLAYIPLGLGFCFGLILFGAFSDRTIIRQTRQNSGVFIPEMRLAQATLYASMIPISFFWYGWSTHYTVHWIVPLLGLVPFAVGIVGLWQRYQAYLIDAVGPQFAASALAAFSVLRSTVAAFLPLAGPSMFSNLGLGWGNSLLGFITLAMIPIPILLQRKGAWLRSKYVMS
ncbi:hypothetical protein NLG97_g2754 [Lecanicillium saksenae]|uniref:Uncharacterized protein n=1 Tax=Lecanicillium saksenae TaxID=468837 RepID=A0ACC1R1W8_9HYPO|nr:hypothetical protein NLG97_g2754 [Lecanicillium saksenae]